MPDKNETLYKPCAVAKKRILLVYESPLVDPGVHESDYQKHFSKILTYRNDAVETSNQQATNANRIVKYCYAVRREMCAEEAIKPFSERKFCCMIAGFKSSQLPGEAVSVRQKLVEFFRDDYPDQFELFGMGWPKDWSINQGPIDDKDSTMKNFKFVVCPENMVGVPGYITEKIWDAFCNGVIPIYMGPPNIDEYIPEDCYINLGKFQNPQDLYNHLIQVTEEDYQRYLKKIRSFLSTNKAKLFSPESFASIFAQALLDSLR